MNIPEPFDPMTKTLRFEVRVTKQFLISFRLLSFISPPLEGRLIPDSGAMSLLLQSKVTSLSTLRNNSSSEMSLNSAKICKNKLSTSATKF